MKRIAKYLLYIMITIILILFPFLIEIKLRELQNIYCTL